MVAAVVVGLLMFRDTVTEMFSSATGKGTPATVVVDGQPLSIERRTTCSRNQGKIVISISSGISAVVIDSDPPEVDMVSLGEIDGVDLTYSHNIAMDPATVARNDKTFTISGIAEGTEMNRSNPVLSRPVAKQFEITATCSKFS